MAGNPTSVPTAAWPGTLIIVTGRVQGVGFRPFISRLASEHRLSGWVRNRAGHVEIAVCGSRHVLDAFIRDIVERAPPLARPRLEATVPTDLEDTGTFLIRPSQVGDAQEAELPPDYFVCDDCLAEMADPAARRYRYPFINCTQCGPRYTIIRALPYDRPNTTMADFVLCDACRQQYQNPLDRRYHAQPLACPVCGPRLWFRGAAGTVYGNEAALAEAVKVLDQGLTLVVKGIGGYHLLCDATRQASVTRLRTTKRRPHKPFAVMVPMSSGDGLGWARRIANSDEMEARLLTGPARPIVLVRRREGSPLAPDVAPGLEEVGLMLPYSPLHHLLLQAFDKPVVATSANISGEPVLTDAADVEARLAHCCDGYLHHDRPIHRPADDPVVRVIAGRGRPIRLGRGTAPLMLDNPFPLNQPTVGCGGQLRATLALGWNRRVVVSPHIGDLGSVRSAQVFERTADELQTLFGIAARRYVCDAHPGFSARSWTRRRGQTTDLVHHHYAHASALAGEHGVTAPMLVFAWDGVGLGADDKLWGGETLYGSPGRWRQIGTFRPLKLAGGDAVAHEPWRSAAAICWELGIPWQPRSVDSRLVRYAWQRDINTHESSAVGRLFDAAAALLGVIETASYDGQAPALLEALTRGATSSLPLRIDDRGPVWIVDWEPLMRELLNQGSAADGADLFHAALAGSVLDQARLARRRLAVHCIGLSGGVFQNRRLAETAYRLLQADGFQVLLHEQVPCNDGGLSYGQLVEYAGRESLGDQSDAGGRHRA